MTPVWWGFASLKFELIRTERYPTTTRSQDHKISIVMADSVDSVSFDWLSLDDNNSQYRELQEAFKKVKEENVQLKRQNVTKASEYSAIVV
jgi:hypothetical protein